MKIIIYNGHHQRAPISFLRRGKAARSLGYKNRIAGADSRSLPWIYSYSLIQNTVI